MVWNVIGKMQNNDSERMDITYEVTLTFLVVASCEGLTADTPTRGRKTTPDEIRSAEPSGHRKP